jgi:hypothetical protein
LAPVRTIDARVEAGYPGVPIVERARLLDCDAYYCDRDAPLPVSA